MAKTRAIVCPNGHEEIVELVEAPCGEGCTHEHRNTGVTTYPCGRCGLVYMTLPHEADLHLPRNVEEVGVAFVALVRGMFPAGDGFQREEWLRESLLRLVVLARQADEMVAERVRAIREGGKP